MRHDSKWWKVVAVVVGLFLGTLLAMAGSFQPKVTPVAYDEILAHPELYRGQHVRVEGYFLEVDRRTEETTVPQVVGHTGAVPIMMPRKVKREVPVYVFSAKPAEQYSRKDRCIRTRVWPEKYLGNGRCIIRGIVIPDGNGGYVLT